MRSINWSAAPDGAPPTQQKNFLKVQIDGFGVGLEQAAAIFLPVFLTRLGATNYQIGLLTAMPAFTGLLLTMVVGRFLQSRRNIVPWHSGSRLLFVSSYALIGVVCFIVPEQYKVPVVLAIRMAATFSLPVLGVAFTVVMNSVAGARGRYALASRRWSIASLTSAITVMVVGQVLHRLHFPANYQLIFIALSTGGLISYFSSIRIELPDTEPLPRAVGKSLSQRFKDNVNLIRGERAFVTFTSKWFVYKLGSMLSLPLFPLYYVRGVHATDAWIGIKSFSQTVVMPLGFFLWSLQRKARGSRRVLLWTMFGLAIYPALTASTQRVEWIALYAGLAGILLAGLSLVFFDEQMKTIPVQYSAIFVSLIITLEYLSAVVAPMLGTLLANYVGLGGALVASALVRLVGFGLFALSKEGTDE